MDKNNTWKLKVSSVDSIKKVIDFMQNAPVKLTGYKKLQYKLWLTQLESTTQTYYKKINIPQDY